MRFTYARSQTPLLSLRIIRKSFIRSRWLALSNAVRYLVV